MGELVERVGRILFRQARGVPCPPKSQNWTDYEKDAREIVAAMREPTGAMLSSSTSVGLSLNQGWQAQKTLYQRMIDADLSERLDSRRE